MKNLLLPIYPADSEQMKALDEAIKVNSQSKNALSKIDHALKTVKTLAKQGTDVATLYQKAEQLFHQIIAIIS